VRLALSIIATGVLFGLSASLGVGLALADVVDDSWEIASKRSRDGTEWSVYVEAEKTPGRPAFRIETTLEVSPWVAATTLMEEMSEPGGASSGQTRRLIERTERDALVHTFIDLPFMFSDRELAIRIRYTDDPGTGVHRIEWVDENGALPPVDDGVLRLATEGYWEFRPMGPNRSGATYVSRAEVGGSLPRALGDRLMKGQAEDAVKRLQHLLGERGRTHVAGPPPLMPLAPVAPLAPLAPSVDPVEIE
jgi:hypothetical protein